MRRTETRINHEASKRSQTFRRHPTIRIRMIRLLSQGIHIFKNPNRAPNADLLQRRPNVTCKKCSRQCHRDKEYRVQTNQCYFFGIPCHFARDCRKKKAFNNYRTQGTNQAQPADRQQVQPRGHNQE